MAKNLVIVESPAKAKTIEKYLGKDYTVRSSVGHIRDLVKKGLGVDTENNFEPTYEISPDKKAVVKELKDLAKKAEVVWLATDEDREGEAISWHLLEALKLDESKTRRVVYNEITKDAIIKAINKPRTIDFNLVNAQQARRVLDRLVGFELSPVLWRKVKPSLSAGRVQSVAVRLIVEREREIQDFVPQSSFRIVAYFDAEGNVFKATLTKNLKTESEAFEFLQKSANSIFSVAKLDKKPAKKSPVAPFTTSTLQQEAGRKLGYAVGQTMSVAQKLYEQGYITYMRTDSTNLSNLALEGIEDEVINSYGKEYHNKRIFKTKNKDAQEAHEAIRPTDFSKHQIDGDYQNQRLYELIWKRAVASQMSDAQLERTTVTINVSESEKDLIAKGEILKFDGFLKLYLESTDDDQEEEEGMLPELKTNQELILTNLNARERFTKHPPRYTESSLVKAMEERGIGRPSTYAPTISTIQKRTYVVKEERDGVERNYKFLTLEGGHLNTMNRTELTGAEKNKLFPTDIGILVNDFLVQNFSKIVDYGFTAEVEQQFDQIAQGLKDWKSMIDSFYHPFHENVEETIEKSERITGERQLGIDPKSGKKVIVRMGKFGPIAQIGEVSEDGAEKPKFAGLRKGQSIQNLSLEDALELFKLPRTLGELEGKPVKSNIGRFGPYVQNGSLFASIPKEEDPLDITFDRALELIAAKKKADAEKFINSFEHEDGEIQVLNGRWGPYIKQGRKNYKIPKDVEAKDLAFDEVLHIMKNQPKKAIKRKSTKKKTTKKKQ
ncbi:MAG: DNA topoisomerase I [Flavobacteriales bacterium]|nr:DNA topoisomerase I [Flavobacteriales bacterium]|tara:strand:+ start:750 stop:3086 length:2337 start_codon:yes stop_codon:yes gene_type:complete